MPPLAHSSLNHKRHLDRFSRFCTAPAIEIRYTLQRVPPFLLKLPLPMGDVDPNLIHGSLGHAPESSIETVSRSVQPFLHGAYYCDRPTDGSPTDHAGRGL